METFREYGTYAMIVFAVFMAYFGYYALRDLLKQQKAKKSAAATDENNDIWNAFPGPIPWSGRCSCGWECRIGNTTTSFFLAADEEAAKVKVLSYHQAQIKSGANAPHNPTMDDITVYLVDAPA